MSADEKNNRLFYMTNGDIEWLAKADRLAIESTGFDFFQSSVKLMILLFPNDQSGVSGIQPVWCQFTPFGVSI